MGKHQLGRGGGDAAETRDKKKGTKAECSQALADASCVATSAAIPGAAASETKPLLLAAATTTAATANTAATSSTANTAAYG